MTEKEKMIAGELYLASDSQLLKERQEAQLLFQEFNALTEINKTSRNVILKSLIGNLGTNFTIEPPFFCDYGYNITIGKNVYINYGCCILDGTKVIIGDNCMFGPNVQIYTATHPLEYKARNSGKEFSKPITIGHNVWIGGNATICPGITLGNNVVVGAGSVVTKGFPDDVLIAGNPAKIIKTINN
ncbi:sugar O-acetyltransferase [Winogradskyella bathintestinalis]|uniref:Acetyltransferase n=1 Tax=Winogradskyella bathintestinalis TaxID=3035208 RepID=A0ABT7ZYP9_9FLAO|nr:sugar O-acetyltransferase [Winogradskyella bathintestinalis]MDN3494151.1 sugar O-acetyltransferase [Winogradskyella bathintestinalis]